MPYTNVVVIQSDPSGSSYFVNYATKTKTQIPTTISSGDPSTWIEVPYGCFIQTGTNCGVSLAIAHSLTGSVNVNDTGSYTVMKLHRYTTMCPKPCPYHSRTDIPWGIFDTFWNHYYGTHEKGDPDDDNGLSCGCELHVPYASTGDRG